MLLTRLISSLRVGGGGADVGGTVIAVGSHHDMLIGTHHLGSQLVFDKQFPWQGEESHIACSQATDLDLMSRVRAVDPGELVGVGDVSFCRAFLNFLDEIRLFEIRGNRKADRFKCPANVRWGNGTFLCFDRLAAFRQRGDWRGSFGWPERHRCIFQQQHCHRHH